MRVGEFCSESLSSTPAHTRIAARRPTAARRGSAIGLTATRLRADNGLEKERGPFGPPSLTNTALYTGAYSASVFTIFGRPRFTSTPDARFSSNAANLC